MRVDSLQSGIVKWVLEKVTEYSDEEASSDSVISLLLSQFRWLDFVADASSRCQGCWRFSLWSSGLFVNVD